MLQERDTPFLEGCAEKAEPFFLFPFEVSKTGGIFRISALYHVFLLIHSASSPCYQVTTSSESQISASVGRSARAEATISIK